MTPTLERTEITFSKIKLMPWLALIVLFVFISLLFLFGPNELFDQSSRHNSSAQQSRWNVRILGFVYVVVFFVAAKSIFTQMTRSEPALILDSEGINDHTSDFSQGLIKWSDIDEVSQLEVDGSKLISLHMKKPVEYGELNETLLAVARKATHLLSEDSINISTQDLSVDFDGLFVLIRGYHNRYKSTT